MSPIAKAKLLLVRKTSMIWQITQTVPTENTKAPEREEICSKFHRNLIASVRDSFPSLKRSSLPAAEPTVYDE